VTQDPRREAQPPELVRRRLRFALREAREAAGIKQQDAADALDWHVSKIIRIEQGAVGITPVDLRALLDIYGVKDESRVAKLVDLARGSRGQSWAEYKEVYSPATLDLFGSEAGAKSISKYEPTFVAGLLQTEEYARALMEGLGHEPKEVELKVSARIERQELLLERNSPPELHFILGEAAVSRAVGGPRVMSRQLERIKELGMRPGISLQILRFSVGAHPHMGGAFTILEFPDESLDDLLYLENAGGERTIRHEPRVLADYWETFRKLEAISTKPDKLADVLDRIQAERFEGTAHLLNSRRIPSEPPGEKK
jgi:transcriptional regulator with XRE-family HTH domain